MNSKLKLLAVVSSLIVTAPLAMSLSLLAFAQTASAAPSAEMRTTVFAIKNMTCPLCPITVRTAMQSVPGVQTVKTDLDTQTATVTYDPAKTTVHDIAAASANAGYPAEPAN